MTESNWKLIIGAFADDTLASQALASLEAARRSERVGYEDVAVIRRSEDGKLHIKDLGQVSSGRAATIGGAIGAAIGLLAGPAGVVVGGATGAWIAGVAAATTDTGIPDSDLEQIGTMITAGCSAIVVFTTKGEAEPVEKTLVNAGGRLLTDSAVEGATDTQFDCGGTSS